MVQVAAAALGFAMKPPSLGQTPAYTEFHPRWYRPRVSTYWWLWSWPYTKFVLREMSSIFVALFVVITLFQIRALGQGPEAYARFEAQLSSRLFVLLNLVVFMFVLLHAITWFNLAPKAIVVRVGGKRVSGFLIAASNYGAWLVVSAIVAWFLLGG
jgi:fumarate reductase subunit C